MSSHAAARAARAGEILENCIASLLGKNIPADKFLSGLFRSDRRMGSRDRRFVSDVVFAYFRWRGFAAAAGLEKDQILPAVFACEGILADTAEFWCGKTGIPYELYEKTVTKKSSSLERFSDFLKIAKVQPSREITIEDILPDWALPMLEDEAKKDLPLMQSRPGVWLRAGCGDSSSLAETLRKKGIASEKHPVRPEALKIPGAKGNLALSEEYLRGDFEMQDLSSQCIGLASGAKPGESWWDACAGAGGKTLQLASIMGNKGSILASDVRASALLELKKRAARTGIGNMVSFAVGDCRNLHPGKAPFDGILVDAPCSGSGRWRRNPDARWSCSEETVHKISALQAAILDTVSSSVKTNGLLVYATCSLFRRENTDIVKRFLDDHPEFELESFPHPLFPARMTDGMLAVTPSDADCDGSFVCRMRRKK